MISIGFQFDYELNSKNHSKKIKNVLDYFSIFFDFFWILFDLFLSFWFFFFDFFGLFFRFFSIFFWFFSISIGFQLFFLKFDFFRFFSIFFWFFSISIGFQLDFFGFQLDFNWIFSWALAKQQAWEKKKNKKKQKPNPKLFFIFLILIGSIPKSNRIEIQKIRTKSKKIEENKKFWVFFITLKSSNSGSYIHSYCGLEATCGWRGPTLCLLKQPLVLAWDQVYKYDHSCLTVETRLGNAGKFLGIAPVQRLVPKNPTEWAQWDV